MSKEEQERGLRALAEAERFSDELVAKRGGELFPDSTKLIRQQREERRLQRMLDRMEEEAGPVPDEVQRRVDALPWPD